MKKIFLDTDIGDDIDDALALGLLLASPEVELVGISTVFKNTVARSCQARTFLKIAGFENVPVAAGCGMSISPQLRVSDLSFDPLKAYLENELPNQHMTSLPEESLPPLQDKHGVDLLIETLLKGQGDISLLTIGPMTNIAMAIVKEPRIISKIPKIIAMAGSFENGKVEWNVLCDAVAMQIVLNSGIPVDMIGLDVTAKVVFSEDDLEQLNSFGDPLSSKLFEAISAWQNHIRRIEPHRTDAILPILHDPLAALTIIDQDIVEWKSGLASVDLDRDGAFGLTVFEEKANGPHRYASDVDARSVISLWLDRIRDNGRAALKAS